MIVSSIQPLNPRTTLARDLSAGLVVFFVALPLSLGVALASNAPLFSGLLTGIVGGVLVGLLSGSQTAISGPAAGLTAVVAAQLLVLGSFPAFLLALAIAGIIQIALGLARVGFFSAFFPSSVIKGLLTAIGLILILKQIPHLVGHDPDPEGEMAFLQPDSSNTLLELLQTVRDIHPGAALIGLLSVALLLVWDRWKFLRNAVIPGPLLVVLLGVGVSLLLSRLGAPWAIEASHRVQVPLAESVAGYLQALQHPDFSQWRNPAIYVAAVTIAAVASLETLLNLEAIENLDPERRDAPANRELLAQGVGNLTLGLIGGLPVCLVIARSSVNIQVGARTKLATITQGTLILVSVVLLPTLLNQIPLSCLAAILFITGFKLARVSTFRAMWGAGPNQFVPFITTVLAIVFTDLLTGILIGLSVSLSFIIRSSIRRPIRRIVEKHLGGEVVRIELGNQVSFLNRAALARNLDAIPRGGQLLLDAQSTDYIDPDVLDLIRDFKEQTGPIRGVEVSLIGFRRKYHLEDQTQYVDYSTRELQTSLRPEQVLSILKEGHERFRTGHRLTRDLGRQVLATASGQHPLAVILSCIDSRTPAELIFDLGVGDIFSVRMAGNVISRKALGSMEYACNVAGAKLIVVLGHTRCGAVTAAVDLHGSAQSVAEATGCQHLGHVLEDIQESVDPAAALGFQNLDKVAKEAVVNDVSRRNVVRTVERILEQSQTLESLVSEGRIGVVGAIYDVGSGDIEFLTEVGIDRRPLAANS